MLELPKAGAGYSSSKLGDEVESKSGGREIDKFNVLNFPLGVGDGAGDRFFPQESAGDLFFSDITENESGAGFLVEFRG